MGNIFSDRIADVPKSFIREILKVTNEKDIISFAGGLPNRNLFPVEALKVATMEVFEANAQDAFQYSTSEGYLELREWIAKRYKTIQNINVSADDIIITTGSQQALDILGKTLLNQGDNLIIEEPGYLGAIQAFSFYQPNFCPVPVSSDGMNIELFKKTMAAKSVKLCYTVPNFSNPSGITYSNENRAAMAAVIKQTKTILVEDNPYGELRFIGSDQKSFYNLIPDNTVLLGSFSKTVVPSFRIGWLVAKGDLREKLIIAKQAADLHSNYFSQLVLCNYLSKNDIDEHIRLISQTYGSQRNAMVKAIKEYFPKSAAYTEPEGGMFLWITLPEKIKAIEVFYKAIERKVAFVPGDPFYTNKSSVNTLRLNYSCVDEATIESGIKILGNVLEEMMV